MRLSTRVIIIGVLLFLAGLLALMNPFAAALAISTFVGIAFLIGGAFQLWFAFGPMAGGHRFATLLTAFMSLVAGVFLLANPFEGVLSLTYVVGAVFLITGIVRLLLAWQLRDAPPFWVLLLSGAASALLGFLVFAADPAAASGVLGLLLGFELVADGAGLTALGFIGRKRWK